MREIALTLPALLEQPGVLGKEQRSPRWAVTTTVRIDEAARTVVIGYIAGAGAWRLAAQK